MLIILSEGVNPLFLAREEREFFTGKNFGDAFGVPVVFFTDTDLVFLLFLCCLRLGCH